MIFLQGLVMYFLNYSAFFTNTKERKKIFFKIYKNIFKKFKKQLLLLNDNEKIN